MNARAQRIAALAAAGLVGLTFHGAVQGARAQGSKVETARLTDWANDTARRVRSHLPAHAPQDLAAGMHVVTVRFTIDGQGRIDDVTVAESSGIPSLDQTALAAVRQASPVRAPPGLEPGATQAVTQPIRFDGGPRIAAPRGDAPRPRERPIRPICIGCDR